MRGAHWWILACPGESVEPRNYAGQYGYMRLSANEDCKMLQAYPGLAPIGDIGGVSSRYRVDKGRDRLGRLDRACDIGHRQ
jgi:hypothetical protein